MNDEGIGSWVARRRLRSPNEIAISCDGVTLTYAQFADRAESVAAVLSSINVDPGDRIAYFGENSPEFMAVLFGAAIRGAVFVPVNTRLATPEIVHVLRDAGASALIHDGMPHDRLGEIAAQVELGAVISTGGQPDGLVARQAQAAHASSAMPVAPNDPAAIIYTSGTTGRAKGAVLTHANLTWVAINCIIDYGVTSADVALMISPLFHVASLGMGALPIMLAGGTLVVERGFEPGRALAQIERHRVSMLSGVPTTFQLMADHPDWDSTDLSSLRKLTCGGSPAPARIIEAYEARDLRFSQGYGMTEASPGVTALSPAMTRAKQGSVGLPHFFTHVRIASEDGSLAATGDVGEIEISGPNVFSGYHQLPEADQEAFTADGWFRTGDLGYLDEDGYLFIAGRAKDMIISGGENIYPAEVEALITEIAGVTGVAVIGMTDDKWGEVPWAIISVAKGAAVSPDDVLAHLDGRVARYKLPKRVVLVDALPRTASGKVRKVDLRERFEYGSD
jgi:fatty-acyl-CoA synthase